MCSSAEHLLLVKGTAAAAPSVARHDRVPWLTLPVAFSPPPACAQGARTTFRSACRAWRQWPPVAAAALVGVAAIMASFASIPIAGCMGTAF